MTKRTIIPLLIAALVALLLPWLAVTFAKGDNGMAVIFLLFFALVYGLISYSIPLLMLQSFNDAAAVGARAAIAVDPSDAGYESLAEARARDELLARLDWMPAAWRANLQPCAGNGQYADYVSATSRIEVCVQYPYGDPGKAIIPVLSFPGIGAIPNLPQTLKASANLLL